MVARSAPRGPTSRPGPAPPPGRTLALAAALLGACGLIGWVVSRDKSSFVVVGLAFAFAVGALGIAIHSAVSGTRSARVVIWIGLLAPLVYSQARSRIEVINSPISTLSLAQAIVPVLCLGIAMLLSRPGFFPLSRTELWLALFLIIAVLSSAWSVAPLATFLKALQVITAYLLVVLLVRIHRHAGVNTLAEMAGVLHLLILSSLVGLILVPRAALSPHNLIEPVNRLRGVFPYIHPVQLGFMAAVAVILLLTMIGPRWTTGRFVRVGLIALYIGVILLTRTRSSLGLLILGFLVTRLQISRQRAGLLVFGPLLLLIGIVSFPYFSDQVTSFIQRRQTTHAFSTFSGRTVTWSVALAEWKRQPLVGQGYYSGHRLGNLGEELNRETSNTGNVWVSVLLDVGLVGIAPFAGFFLSGVLHVFRRRPLGGMTLVARRSLVLMSLVSSFFIVSLEQVGYGMVIIALILLAPDLPLDEEAEEAEEEQEDAVDASIPTSVGSPMAPALAPLMAP